MLSSTFTDLEQHTAALVSALKGQGLTDICMGNDSAKARVDVIASSLSMVRDASAFIGVISHRYGQTPVDPERLKRGISPAGRLDGTDIVRMPAIYQKTGRPHARAVTTAHGR